METIFSKAQLDGAVTLRADLLKTVYLENKGGSFEIKQLPVQAQFAPIHALVPVDLDKDGDLDLVTGGMTRMCACGLEGRMRIRALYS